MLKLKHIFLLIIGLTFLIYQCKPKTDKTIDETIITEPVVDVVEEVLPEINETENYIQSLNYIKIVDSLPQILVDLKYASDDNFLGFDFYGELKNAFVQYECFLKLKKAYFILQNRKPGYTFIIYDALRSIEAQQLMWDSVKVEPAKKHWYVANPQRGSIHNFGMALDISIVNEIGEVLDMGTEFDFFGEMAFPNKTDYFFKTGDLSQEQYNNRKLLMDIMAEAGFYVSKTEWWHYNASSLDYAKSKYKIFSYPSKFKNL